MPVTAVIDEGADLSTMLAICFMSGGHLGTTSFSELGATRVYEVRRTKAVSSDSHERAFKLRQHKRKSHMSSIDHSTGLEYYSVNSLWYEVV
eukprot:12176-Heterococcus_DN1.PRE.1